MKANRSAKEGKEKLIKACMFIFVSYLFLNIKTYKTKLTSAYLIATTER
jgi:hypothetical protein